MFHEMVPVCAGREALVYHGDVASFLEGTPEEACFRERIALLKTTRHKGNMGTAILLSGCREVMCQPAWKGT